jgi:ABC-type lipoprotein export system ATPase subunit
VRVTRRFSTPTGVVTAVDAVDLDVARGAFTVVSGPSGSGKSTLLGIVACLDRADEGTVEIDGVDVGGLSRRQRRRLRREQLGVVLPHPSDNLFDHLDAQRNVQWADRARGGRTGSIVDAPDALELLGLAQARHRWTRQLSGGEQQRVALACALAGGPTLVVCDEPTASLDRASAIDVVAALRASADRGRSVLVATHDPDVIAAADVNIRLDHGRRA